MDDKFPAMCERYSAALYRHVDRHVHSHEVAEDLVQDTFLKAWLHFGNLSESSEAERQGWLYRVATNLVIDYARRHKLIHFCDVESLSYCLYSSQEMEEQLWMRDQSERLLACLKPIYRETFLLAWSGERTNEEVAHLQQVNIGAVKTRLMRARWKMQAQAREEEREHATAN